MARARYTPPITRSASAASSPRVLVVLNTGAAWCRGILRGFMAAAHERDWTLLHYHPDADIDWLASEWAPAAAVIGPELPTAAFARLAPATLVSVNIDRSAENIASVCLDEAAIAHLAVQHLLGTGLRQLSTFRFDNSPFAIARERAFIDSARAAGARVFPGWGSDLAALAPRIETPAAIFEWLRQLPQPCGIFTCTDSWGRAVARYVRAAGLSVPEQIALVGADNDVLECELISPPLSSVVIPWQELGRKAAQLVQNALAGKATGETRLLCSPLTVMPRRSSDVFAVGDPLVAEAVRWIRANAERRITVSLVAKAVGGGRQRLERRFRAELDRTVHDEIRRAHVDVAKTLLQSTDATLLQVARQSGFTNAALLSVAFQREVGMPPGLYRRRMQHEQAPRDDD
jgi:LacI family transcriptional regulator, galactose operon repressor